MPTKTTSTQVEKCTCNHKLAASDDFDSTQANNRLGASFVHLNSEEVAATTASPSPLSEGRACLHDEVLLKVAEGSEDVSLCRNCLERVARAIQDDIYRLQDECLVYEQAVRAERERQEGMRKHVGANMFPPSMEEANVDIMERAERSFQNEIEVLRNACAQHEAELQNLKLVQAEQDEVGRQLDEIEHHMAEEQNALELEARAFDSIHPILAKKIQQMDQEVEALSNGVRLHHALFDLNVDKQRGLRYPLINGLRLAYGPKGDLQWKEIATAWAQVLQLVLFIGTSLRFKSKSWRIVPLSSGGKLMYLDPNNPRRRDVYSFPSETKGMGPALRALTALLDQLITHYFKTIRRTDDGSSRPPHEMSRGHIIGRFDLSKLNDNEDSGWSQVIQCFACNLQWLIDCAADMEANHVLYTTTIMQ